MGSATRERTFLAEEKWKRVPWQSSPKAVDQRLMQIIKDVPSKKEEHHTVVQLDKDDQVL